MRAVKFVRGVGTDPFWVGLSQMSPPGVDLYGTLAVRSSSSFEGGSLNSVVASDSNSSTELPAARKSSTPCFLPASPSGS
jgi:hypothetical protein